MILTDFFNAVKKLGEKISFHQNFKVVPIYIIVYRITTLGQNEKAG